MTENNIIRTKKEYPLTKNFYTKTIATDVFLTYFTFRCEELQKIY